MSQSNGVYGSNNKTSISSVGTNIEALISDFQDLVVGTRVDDVSLQFQYNISTRDLHGQISVGSGAMTQANNQLIASTGAIDEISSVFIESQQHITYHPGHTAFCYFTAEFDNFTITDTGYIGAIDDEDGFAIGYKAGVFGFLRRKNSVDVEFVSQSNFDDDKLDGSGATKFNLSHQNNNVFLITYGWLGAIPARLYVYGGKNRGWILAHTIDISNKQKGTTIGNPVLPMSIQVSKTGTTSNPTITTGSWNGGIIKGGDISKNTPDRHFNAGLMDKVLSSNMKVPVFTLKSEVNFQGLTNKILSVVGFVSVSSDNSKLVTAYLVKNASLTGSAYIPVDSVNSVMSVDTTATALAGGTDELVIELGKIDSKFIDLSKFDITIHAGDTMTFALEGANGSNGTGSISTRWNERF